jgi:hypothetical protein
MSELTNLTPKQLRQAANLKEKIDELHREMSRILGAVAQDGNGTAPAKRWKFTPAARARMRAAQRARWAKIKGTPPPAKRGRKPKRKVSPAQKARLSAMAKARWKKAKAAGKTTL